MEIGQEAIEAFVSLFRGRDDVWGSVEGKANKEPVTIRHYEKHLRGMESLGIYPLLDDGTCQFFAVDLDEKDFNKAQAIRQELNTLFLPAYIANSKRKGFHLYGFALEQFIARDIRRILQHVLAKLQIKAEIFPKQDTLDKERLPYGNYINLPCFGYTRKFLAGDMREVPLEIALGRIKFIPAESIQRVLETLPEEKTHEVKLPQKTQGKLPCFSKMMIGVPEGCRDEVAFRLGVHLFRQGMPQQLAEAALLQWDAQYNNPPIGTETIHAKVKQAYTGRYGLGCLSALIQPFCEHNCPIYRKRYSEIDHKEGEPDREIKMMMLTRLRTQPPSFNLNLDGARMTLKAMDLLSLRRVKTKAVESMSFIPFPNMKQKEWEMLVNSLLANVTEEEAPEDASLQARYVEVIYEWLLSTPLAERSEDVDAGRPLKKEDGYYFKMKDATHHLDKEQHLRVDPSELYRLVKEVGGGAKTIRVGAKLFKLWHLPFAKSYREEENVNPPK